MQEDAPLTEAQVVKVLNALFDGAEQEYAWRPLFLARIKELRMEALSKASALTAAVNAK